MAVGVAAEVKNKLSVVDVVGESVQLKKAGTTYKGLCPFHGEKTPSFTVTPARDSWKCFGCGEGGDIFSFVMKRDGLTFPEALKVLAAKAGVELDERTSREDAHKKRLRDVLESAIAFYHAVLTGSKTGEPARLVTSVGTRTSTSRSTRSSTRICNVRGLQSRTVTPRFLKIGFSLT